jgi:protein-disulfide isomerase
MSNRQARREQARTSRAPRPQRPTPGSQKRPSSSRGSGGSDIFSRGFLLALGAFAVAAVGIIALVIAFGGGDDDDTDLVAAMQASTADLPTEMMNGTKLGSDDAPVKIVSYEDFQCPFCLLYTAEQEPLVINELVKSGKVQLEYRHLPILGNESFSAAMASQCAADQNKFWPFHHKLFLLQAQEGQADPGGERTNVGRFSDDNLKKFAGELGLDQAAFDECFDSREHLQLVTNQQREANSFGITGTPGFLVNGTPLGTGTPQGIEAWRDIVKQVEDANATATANASASPAASASATTSPAASASASPAASPSATATP